MFARFVSRHSISTAKIARWPAYVSGSIMKTKELVTRSLIKARNNHPEGVDSAYKNISKTEIHNRIRNGLQNDREYIITARDIPNRVYLYKYMFG